MKRVMIMGCCGAGKSTLARKLHKTTGIELHHLDQLYWKPNWVESDADEFHVVVSELCQNEEWIIDGNYSSTMNPRYKRADTIVYLDYPTLHCLWRITKRIWNNLGKVRPDMPEGCPERFDLEFYHYVATFNIRKRKKMLSTLQELSNEKSVYIFSNDQEADSFLTNLS